MSKSYRYGGSVLSRGERRSRLLAKRADRRRQAEALRFAVELAGLRAERLTDCPSLCEGFRPDVAADRRRDGVEPGPSIDEAGR